MSDSSLRHASARLARAGSRLVHRTPASVIFRSGAVARLRRQLFALSAGDVLAVLDALAAIDARVWVAGGWGIDALVGALTRRHGDLDLVYDADDGGETIVAALGALGYHRVVDRGGAGHWLPVRTVLRDGSGHAIDLLAVRTDASSPERANAPEPRFAPSSFANGTILGRAVPCLSVSAQLRLHSGYPPGRDDVRDLRLLCERHLVALPEQIADRCSERSLMARRAGGARRLIGRRHQTTAVIVPVFEAQDAVALGHAGDSTAMAIPPHITLLYPFVPPSKLADDDHRQLRDALAGVTPLAMTFAAVERFPGVVYLAPDAVATAALCDLIDALVPRWPRYPPYGGRFETVIPHLTVHEGPVEPPALDEHLAALLPVHARVDQAWLVALDGPRWSVLGRFPFGRDGV